MINIAIVEDNVADAGQLKNAILRYAELNNRVFNIELYKNAESFLNYYKADYDMVFMDIELSGISGMEAAKKLRELDSIVVLIFVTNLSQMACDGYAVNALDFLVKPLQYTRFSAVIDRAILRISLNCSNDSIIIRTVDFTRRIAKSSILFVEMQQHRAIFHTDERNYSVYGTLKKIKEQLAEKNFVLCNSCYLVNLRYVNGIEGDNVILRNYKLRISRPKKKSFMEALNEYLSKY